MVIALAGVASAITVKWSVGEMTYYGSGNQRIQSALIAGSLTGAGATGDTIGNFVSLANNSASFGDISSSYTSSLTKLGVNNEQISGVPTSGKAPYNATAFTNVTLEVGKTYSILFGDAWWYSQSNGGHQYIQWAEFTVTQAMLDKAGDTLHLYVETVDLKNGSVISGAADVLNPQQIPEPTALALLALGVAGLALRRRMA